MERGFGHSVELVRLGPDDWILWRKVRLDALRQDPCAFALTLTDCQGDGDNENRWRARLSAAPFHVVSYPDRAAAGMVSSTAPANHVVELTSLWVAPFARGRGIGDALIMAVIGWAEDQRARSISLEVSDNNVRAIRLYRRRGFIDGGTIESADPASPPKRKMILERGDCACCTLPGRPRFGH